MGVMLVMRLIAHWQHCVITEINSASLGKSRGLNRRDAAV